MQPPSAPTLPLSTLTPFSSIQPIYYSMRIRKGSTHKSRARRSSTPTTPSGRIEAKRQHLKKQRIRQQTKDGSKAPGRRQKRAAFLAFAALKAKRERWAAIARETQEIVLGDGKYVDERHPSADLSAGALSGVFSTGSTALSSVVHDISAQIALSRQGTVFYPHYSESLASWVTKRPALAAGNSTTAIEFTRKTTLAAAHLLSRTFPHLHSGNPLSLSRTSLGVLSFASPKKPGGGYLHGGDEQEESIARLSSLVASLSAPAAGEFYKEHKTFRNEDGSGLHDHSMVYSPGVVVFRADWDDNADIESDSPLSPISPTSEASSTDDVGGQFIPPYTINVLSAVPVNSAAVRAKHVIRPEEQQFFEDGIRHTMKERIARALRLFEERGNKVLVLGAFGCGSSENKVETIAGIFAELLVCGDYEGRNILGEEDGRTKVGDSEGQRREARFKDVFERVVFAVPGKLFEPFMKAFETRVHEEVARAPTSHA